MFMSYMKRAIEEIEQRGWPLNDASLKRLTDTIREEHGKSFYDWTNDKKKKNDKDREISKDGEVR